MAFDRNTDRLQAAFYELADRAIAALQPGEHLTLDLNGERSQFVRFNQAKVRQTGTVEDGNATLTFLANGREVYASFPFTGDTAIDTAAAIDQLNDLRLEAEQVPENPYIVFPQHRGSSCESYGGHLLDPGNAIAALLDPVSDLDFVGFYAAGTVIRANANSAGQRHWFSTESFCIDYSIFADGSDKAVKGTYAGRHWEQDAYVERIARARSQLPALSLPPKAMPPGTYRTYFAPAAVADLVGMLRSAPSEAALRQGHSAFLRLWRQETSLSPLCSLHENFRSGSVPRFNDLGEISPEDLAIVEGGKLVATLIGSRTAKEYGLAANGASSGEYMRSPEMAGGSLPTASVLSALGTGLYLSNLHYLNWSDRANGRLTGMTRYACFWVEGGEVVAPIQDLRFDDSLYSFMGDALAALTAEREFIPDVDTYGSRSLGGILVPGMLVNAFAFTL